MNYFVTSAQFTSSSIQPLATYSFLLASCFSSENLQDGKWVGGSLPSPIIHIQHSSKSLKSKFSQIIAEVINIDENVGTDVLKSN